MLSTSAQVRRAELRSLRRRESLLGVVRRARRLRDAALRAIPFRGDATCLGRGALASARGGHVGRRLRFRRGRVGGRRSVLPRRRYFRAAGPPVLGALGRDPGGRAQSDDGLPLPIVCVAPAVPSFRCGGGRARRELELYNNCLYLVEPYVEAVVDDERDDVVGHWLEAARPHEHRHELLPVRLRVGLEVAGLKYFL